MNDKVEVVVYGNFACFTMTETKIDRVSYPVPTPSACRGILCAIYYKPSEFWYEIVSIDVLKPIRYISIKKNEVKKKISVRGGKADPIDVNEQRTQRNTVYLSDVAYKITARMVVRDTYLPGVPEQKKLNKVKSEFERRVKNGKCFWQPYLGTRECMCFFREPEETDVPINESADFGITLYDIFDPGNNIPLNTDKKAKETCVPCPSYYRPVMQNGHIEVPDYRGSQVIRTGDLLQRGAQSQSYGNQEA